MGISVLGRPAVTAVDVTEAERLRQAGALVIDIRDEQEWSRGHITGALHLPLDQLTAGCAALPAERQLLVICQRGFRSAAAVAQLRQAGFAHAINVRGGLNAWTARGLPLEGSDSCLPSQGFAARSLGFLDMQGYADLDLAERRGISLGLRLTTATCMTLILAGLALRTPLLFFGLAGMALIGALAPRHPFDLIWQYGVRHLVGGAPLPPNPVQRRIPFWIAVPWLGAIGVCFAAGYTAAAFLLGLSMAASCALVTFTHYCLPSAMLAGVQRRRRPRSDRAMARDG